MEQFLREWRRDALNKNQHDAAIFIGDKLLALTDSTHDAWWLAQVHFSKGNYTRAQSYILRADFLDSNPQCRYLCALCHVKLGKYEEALALLGDARPTHLVKAPGSARRKLKHLNGNSKEARISRRDEDDERAQDELANIKAEAAMCYLRGVCYARQNAFEKAKECYKDAVRIDVLNFEAFDALMSNSLMSPTEEWEFLNSLNFDSIVVGDGTDASTAQEAAEFTKLLYTTRLSRYGHSADFATATETLSTHYKLGANPDIQLSKASLLYTQCRFRAALELTSSILESDPYNASTLPLHLACLHELQEKNALYLLSHTLADVQSNSPLTYLAIGTYYLTINSIASARRYFSQASVLDPTLAAAWLGFAHTFSIEGEHEQAISAYSTAARLFPGTHLPNLFLGMQNLALGNLKLAKEYLKLSWDTCNLQNETQEPSTAAQDQPVCGDPLLLNELGVVFYHEQDYERAIHFFSQALRLAHQLGSPLRSWASTRGNLAHALRRVGNFSDALEQFNLVLRVGGKDAAVFAAKGLVLMEMGEMQAAAVALHEALAVSPQDPMATELLNRCMTEFEAEPVGGADPVEEDDEFERKIGELAAQFPRRGRRGRRKGKDVDTSAITLEDESMLVDEDD